MSTLIPQPPTIPILGNVWDIDPKNSIQSLVHLGEKYGKDDLPTVNGRC
jgi:hypothetical protein